MKRIFILVIFLGVVGGVAYAYSNRDQVSEIKDIVEEKITESVTPEELHPLMIETLKDRTYDSQITIEQDLGDMGVFRSYVISYPSEGNKIRALMNVPDATKPEGGWPVLFLNHGHIPPTQYSTINSYKAFADYYSRQGFLVLKPDYRGHGDSEGTPVTAHLSHDYVIDVLNLVAAIKKHPDANPDKIGMWGHSNGGRITLHTIVVSKDIKASMLVAGVVASPEEFIRYGLENDDIGYIRENAPKLQAMVTGPEFLKKISPYSYLNEVVGPVSVHHGTADTSVPLSFSQEIRDALKDANIPHEYFEYPGADHNLANAGSRSIFLQRSLEFFNKNIK